VVHVPPLGTSGPPTPIPRLPRLPGTAPPLPEPKPPLPGGPMPTGAKVRNVQRTVRRRT